MENLEQLRRESGLPTTAHQTPCAFPWGVDAVWIDGSGRQSSNPHSEMWGWICDRHVLENVSGCCCVVAGSRSSVLSFWPWWAPYKNAILAKEGIGTLKNDRFALAPDTQLHWVEVHHAEGCP
eukprot:5266246-Amphidinium_carterae.2